MAKAKIWVIEEVEEIIDYLGNIGSRSAENLLRVYDDAGNLLSTVRDQAHRASAALIDIAEHIDPEWPEFTQAIDGWCDEFLVEGGREKLLTALRTRRYRAEKAKAKSERPPRDAASILSWLYGQDPAAAAEACAVFLDGWQRTEKPRGTGKQSRSRKAKTEDLEAQLAAAEDQVKQARSKMQKSHPDKGGNADAFHQAKAQFEIAKRKVAELKDLMQFKHKAA